MSHVINFATGGGLTFDENGIKIQSCAAGQTLKVDGSQKWQCAPFPVEDDYKIVSGTIYGVKLSDGHPNSFCWKRFYGTNVFPADTFSQPPIVVATAKTEIGGAEVIEIHDISVTGFYGNAHTLLPGDDGSGSCNYLSPIDITYIAYGK
jgi:hypothetical protein